jgi:hypothetical protein
VAKVARSEKKRGRAEGRRVAAKRAAAAPSDTASMAAWVFEEKPLVGA